VEESILVGRALSGDLDAYGRLYDSAFARVYDFAWRSLRDVDQAAEATRETFASAPAQAAALGRAPSFRAWIFGIAHQVVARRQGALPASPGGPQHDEGFGVFDVPDPALVDPAQPPVDAETAALVWEGVAALDARDYAAVHLLIRERFSPQELGWVLGLERREVKEVARRIEPAATDVVRTYMLARQGSKRCDRISDALAGAGFPPFSDGVRRAADAHAAECDTCSATRDGFPAPLPIFASFAAADAPLSLKAEAWIDNSAGWARAFPGFASIPAASEAGDAMPRPSPLRPAAAAGAPPPPRAYLPQAPGDGDASRNRWLIVGAAAAGLLLFAFAGGALLAGGFGGDGGGSGGAGTATPESTSEPGAGSATPRIVTPTPPPATETPLPTDTPLATETPTPAPATDTPVATETPTPAPATATPTRTPRGFRPSATPEAGGTGTPGGGG
jgi:DNA-directed RNA polymerase specialized sigma24 family protein